MSWRSRPMSKEEIKAAADRAEGRRDDAAEAEAEAEAEGSQAERSSRGAEPRSQAQAWRG